MIDYVVNRKIRIAIVGCGRISERHFSSIAGHSEHLDLIAICDTDRLTLDRISRQYKVKAYQDLETMLVAEALDLIVLCTPSGLHSQQAILAAKYKVNVVTEKPMATRWKDGLRMVKACDEAAVRLFVVKQNRFNATIKLVKQALMERRFGKIYMVQVNVFWTRPQSYYDQGSGWRGTWEFDGGALMNQASHYVDLLDWLIGPVEQVQAMTSTTREIEVEDTAVLNVRWRNGALGSMSVTMLAYPKNIEGSITILGESGTVRLGGQALNAIQLWQFAEIKDYDIKVQDLNYDPSSVYGDGHSLYYNNMIKVMRGEAEPSTDGREGLRSLELLAAAYISVRDNRMVTLPLEY